MEQDTDGTPLRLLDVVRVFVGSDCQSNRICNVVHSEYHRERNLYRIDRISHIILSKSMQCFEEESSVK